MVDGTIKSNHRNDQGQGVFRPAWWLPGGHAQTLWRKVAPPPPIEQRRERIELADEDFIDLDWATGVAASDTLVLILHGLCGCSRSPYVQSLQAELTRRGVASVAMNFRGCSGETNRLARAYHSGVSDDLDVIIGHLRQRFPDRRLACVGYSLGANVLLKWLGECGDGVGVSRAVGVSTPFDLASCSRAMLAGMSRAYGRYFTRRLVRDFQAKQRYFARNGDTEQQAILAALVGNGPIRNIWQFDDQITAPLHGFANAEDYYRRCSSRRFLAAIRRDTLLIHSTDDPLIPPAVLPDPGELPDHVRLQLSNAGGHVGFIDGPRAQWLETRIANFILA